MTYKPSLKNLIFLQRQLDFFTKKQQKTTTDHQNSLLRAQQSIKGLIPIENIYYFKAENKSIVVHTLYEQYFITGTLNELETELDESFLRIHRNALISTRYLDGLQKNSDGDWCVIFSDIKDKLKISRREMPHIRRWLKLSTVHPH